MVIVDLRSGLTGICTQDPPGVLDESAFEGERCGEEQGVQGGTVEAFADVRAGGDDKEAPSGRVGLEPGQCGRASFGAHAAAEHNRVVAQLAEHGDQTVKVTQPLSQHEAVPASGECIRDVTNDLGRPDRIGGEVVVDRGDPAWGGRVGLSRVTELRGMDAQVRSRMPGQFPQLNAQRNLP